MSGNHRPGMAVRLRQEFREWRRMKTTILATAISILLIFFNEVLAK
jgi:hypothetical protein